MLVTTKKQNHILIIDDDPNNTDILSKRLSRRGYKCQEAIGGRKALEELAEGEFDLVLLDYTMPEISGPMVLQKIRDKHTEAELPVIMVTGHTEQAKIIETLELGANDFVSKPYNFKVLLARIRSLLASKNAYDALRESQQRYAMVLESSDDGLWDWRIDQDTIYVSPKWHEMLELPQNANATPGIEEWLAYFHEEERQLIFAQMNACVQGEQRRFACESRMRRSDGTYRWVELKGRAIANDTGNITRLLGSLRDITENKVIDPLTGLSNRLLLKHRLALSLQRKKRNPEYKFAVLYLDLDQFKMINDSMGHAIGDLLLKEAANRISDSVRASDLVARIEHHHLVARMGGDEFTILLEDLHNATDAQRIAQRIAKVLEKPFILDGREIFISTSIGIAWSDGEMDYNCPEELLRDADNAMYSAKSKGRGRCELFDQEMHTKAVTHLEIEMALRQAIVEKQFSLHYQPLINLATKTICGFEALVRWNHPEKGMISPMHFIPIAEESGLIAEIGEYVFEQACQQLKEWHDQGFDYLEMNINLSRKQFFATNLPKQCQEVLEKYKLDPRLITLEITESCVMASKDRESQVLEALRALGMRMAIDDFGTGYSSLSILHQCPFDTLKLDRSFIAKMHSTSKEAKLVKHIIALAHDLGLSVTAEGIEDESQMLMLQEMHCSYAQGYFFSRPLPADKATNLLKDKQHDKETTPIQTASTQTPAITPSQAKLARVSY